MNDAPESSKLAKLQNRRVHMANERTFLAWVRTSIGIMAFGFVVERFALFMKQFSFLFSKEGVVDLHATHGYSSIFGIVLVGFGVFIAVLSFVRYKNVQQQIDNDTFQPASSLPLILALSVMITGIFLMIFLVRSL